MNAAVVIAFICFVATAYSHEICWRYGNRAATFPDRNDCSKYYECSRGRLISRQCRDGLLYNPRYARCVLPQDSGCSNYESYIDARNKEYCEIYGESALFSNVLKCDKFYECANGVPVQFDCPAGLVFNSTLKRCDYPNQTTCVTWLSFPSRRELVKADETIEDAQVDDLVEEQVAFPDEYGVESQTANE